MRLEPNLSMLFTELPFPERPAAAAAAGFNAAEMWWPFAEPDPGDAEVERLARAFDDAGVTLACLNFDGGDFAAGERGLVGVPGKAARFRANVDVAVGLAERLGCRLLNALYGNLVEGTAREAQDALAIENLGLAVAAADRIGARVILEAINPVDVPRYGLHRAADSIAFAKSARATAGLDLWFSLDVYHAVRAGDAPVEAMAAYGDHLAHVQLADVPGRHEPGSGTIDFGSLRAALVDRDYDGWVGLEYVPQGASAESLGTALEWLVQHGWHGPGAGA